jgi:hypothetical protein
MDSSGAAAGSLLMTSTTSNGTEGDPQPPQGGELVIVDLRHATIMPPHGRSMGPLPWPVPAGTATSENATTPGASHAPGS